MSNKKSRRALLLAALILAACLPTVPAAAAIAQYFIEISIDGGGSGYIQSLVDANLLPNFKRFQTEGAWTNNARNDYDITVTLPNHTSMVTGRGVYGVGNNGHLWTSNSDPAVGQTIHSNKGSYVASIFDVVHDNGLRTAVYATKTKFSLFDTSYDSTNGTLDVTGADNGRDKLDTYVYNADSSTLTNSFTAAMAANPFHYSLVHYNDTDTVGHASGWGSTAYNDALIAEDGYLAKIFSLVTTNPTLMGKTDIILTADHGGNGTDHSNASDPLNYTIPFYVWGPDATPGADLYSLNTGVRGNPGASRIAYTNAQQPIRNSDGANMVLGMLGLPAIPGSTVNTSRNLVAAHAVYSGGTWQEDFGSLGTSGTSLPAGWSIHEKGTAASTYVAGSPITAAAIAAASLSTTQSLVVWNAPTGAMAFSHIGGNVGLNVADADRALGLSPTGVDYMAIQLALNNRSGGLVTMGTFSYDLRTWPNGTEDLPGVSFFYSLTGGTGAAEWIAVPSLGMTAAGRATAAITFPTAVPHGNSIWFRWADDNGSPSPDWINAIDNVSFQAVYLRSLTWNASAHPSGQWNTAAGNQPWTAPDASPAAYQDGEPVNFAQAGNVSITVAAAVSPGSMTISHSGGVYTFSGATINAGLVKSGEGGAVFNTPTHFSTVAVSAGSLSFSGTSHTVGTLTLTGGTLSNNSQATQLATADFSAPGTGQVLATANNPLAITSTLKLPAGTTAALSGGGSFKLSGSGNLAAAAATRTLTLSGGTLLLTTPATSFGPTIGLVGYWKLDDAAGSATAADSSFGWYADWDANGHTTPGTAVLNPGTLAGANAAFTAAGKFGGALVLGNSGASTQGYLKLTGTAQSPNTGNSPTNLGAKQFTLSAWIKRSGGGITGNSGTGGVDAVPIIAKGRGEGDGSNIDCNYFFGVNASGNLAADFESWATSSNNSPVIGTTTLALNTWYHVAASYDGSTWRLYVDGAQVGTATPVTANLMPRYDSIQNAAIGAALNSSGTAAGGFYGLIDDARIYNRALNGTEIGQLYAGPGPGTTSLPNTSIAIAAGAAATLDLGAPASSHTLGALELAAGSGMGTLLSLRNAASLIASGGIAVTDAGLASIGGNVPVVIPPGGSVSVDADATLMMAAPIGAGSVLNKTGDGILVLTTANTYSGATTVLAGTLEIAHPDALPDGGSLTVAASGAMIFGPTAAAGGPATAPAAVPEPGALALLVAAGAAAGCRRLGSRRTKAR